MRQYLLDTPVLSAYLNGRVAAVRLLGPWVARREVGTSILAYGEVVEYLLGRDDYAAVSVQLRDLLREIVPVFVTSRVAERYARLRRRLRPPHGPGLIGDVDTLIAATAIENDLTLVTTDSDFERVPELRLMRLDRAALR